MARLEIDLDKILHNTRVVAGMLNPLGIRLVGVTKACLGNELVAEAMIGGGGAALADSRQENISRLRRNFPDAELELMRPPLGTADPEGADIFFVSSAAQADALLKAAPGTEMRFLLSIETGDGREGVPPELAAREAGLLVSLDGAELAGVATNAACSRPAVAAAGALENLKGVADEVSEAAAQESMMVSAGGSGLLALLGDRGMFAGVTELRCGEALLLGLIPAGAGTVGRQEKGANLEGGYRDAFRLEGTVLEVFEKGGGVQALLDFGLQDVGAAHIEPCLRGAVPAGITSDYLSVMIDPQTFDGGRPAAGDRLAFLPSYYALLAAMTSPFIVKEFANQAVEAFSRQQETL